MSVAVPSGDGVPGVPAAASRSSRAWRPTTPRRTGRRNKADVRGGRAGPDGGAGRRGRPRYRPLRHLPPVPGRPLPQGQDARTRPPSGAVGGGEGGAIYYVQLSARGPDRGQRRSTTWRPTSSPGSGRPWTTTTTGAEVVAIADAMVSDGCTIGAIDELKTAPRGYAKDHPRIELLRRKGLIGWRAWPVEGVAAHRQGQGARRGPVGPVPPRSTPGSTPRRRARASCHPTTARSVSRSRAQRFGGSARAGCGRRSAGRPTAGAASAPPRRRRPGPPGTARARCGTGPGRSRRRRTRGSGARAAAARRRPRRRTSAR